MYSGLGRSIDRELRIKFFLKLISVVFLLFSSFVAFKMNEKKLNEFFKMANINELVQITDTKKSEQSNGDMIDQIFVNATGKTFDEFVSNPN